MSLVICSNKSGNLNTSIQNIQRPFSFVNNLKQTHKIPKDSEIAVQSVKITKDGLIELSKTDKFYSWFGEHLNTQSLTTKPQIPAETTCVPIATQPFLENGETEVYVNIEEYNRRLSQGMKIGIPHPDMFGDGGTAGVVESELDYTGGFQGFKMTYKYNTSLGTSNVFNDHNKYQFLVDIDPGMTITDEGASGTKFTCTSDGDLNNIAWGYDKPLSHMGGQCVFDVNNLRNASGGFGIGADPTNPGGQNFMVGLTRYCNGLNKDIGAPRYFQSDGPGGQRSDIFYDYAVSCEQLVDDDPGADYYLRIYQCTAHDTNFLGGVSMQEVQYYRGATTGPFGDWATSPFTSGSGEGRINMTANGEKIRKIGFKVENEKVSIFYTTDADADVIIAGVNYIVSPTLAGKGNYPVPSRQTNWNMYPKVMLTNNTGTQNNLTLDAYQGRIMKIGNQVFRGGDGISDWFNRMENAGTDSDDIDTRYMFDLSDLTTIYTQHGFTSASDVLDNYEQILILKEDNTNYLGTEGANMEKALGFVNRAILDWSVGTTDTVRGIYYKSDTKPVLTNDASLFIRLNNFTNRSINAGTGRPSKILYHIPRFDTSGREYGTGLYFEPQERVYVALNNSEDLFINEFALDVCQDDEILAKDLVGETIICLHVRKSLVSM
tara:strand:+ start:596 stop:2575 length:1980 start_codon:yes stop_codon:yes gene_type:complete